MKCGSPGPHPSCKAGKIRGVASAAGSSQGGKQLHRNGRRHTGSERIADQVIASREGIEPVRRNWASAARDQLFGRIKRIHVDTQTTSRIETTERSGVGQIDVRITDIQVG